MPRFAANISMLFTELPFVERIAAAAQAGFRAVECQFPYAVSEDELATALKRAGLPMVLHNLPAGDWAGGERGVACLPGRQAEFREGVEQALRYATQLECRQLNCLAGFAPTGVDSAEIESILIENLRFAADRLAPAGIRLLIEAINTRDMPGFFVHTSRHALAVIEAVDRKNIAFQYDAYHMQIMEGNLANTLAANLGKIGHIQIADNPGRHEPGTGEINYPFLCRHLDAIGYDGWIGCEYIPQAGTLAGLGWMAGCESATR